LKSQDFQLYFVIGEGKVKNGQGQRNRQVLGDIGNLDVVRMADGKRITRPITRFNSSLSNGGPWLTNRINAVF
jgi:hypothetical protein